MSHRRPFVMVLALAHGLAVLVRAQTPAPPRLEPGRFVRVTVSARGAAGAFRDQLPIGTRHEGTFLGMSGDSVLFRPSAPASASVTLPSVAIDRIEIASGRRSNALQGLLIGFGIGFALGAATGASCESSLVCDPGPGSAVGYGLALGGLLGLGGAGIGALTSSTRWVTIDPVAPVPPDSARIDKR